MRVLRLDYQRSNNPVPWPGLAVLAAGVVTVVAMGAYYRDLNQRIDFWEERLEHIGGRSGHRPAAARPLGEQAWRAQLGEIEQANQVLRQLGFPWSELFTAVEASGGEHVALLSLEPDIQKSAVKISGEAKDLDAVLDYVRQLARREVFSGVLLQSHQVHREDPHKPVRFTLFANWKVAAP
jgi:hypothetical protein